MCATPIDLPAIRTGEVFFSPRGDSWRDLGNYRFLANRIDEAIAHYTPPKRLNLSPEIKAANDFTGLFKRVVGPHQVPVGDCFALE